MLGKKFHENDHIEIVSHSTLAIKSSVKGHHFYQEVWTHVMNDKLAVFTEPHNEVDKYTVCDNKKHVVVNHLGKNGRFSVFKVQTIMQCKWRWNVSAV